MHEVGEVCRRREVRIGGQFFGRVDDGRPCDGRQSVHHLVPVAPQAAALLLLFVADDIMSLVPELADARDARRARAYDTDALSIAGLHPDEQRVRVHQEWNEDSLCLPQISRHLKAKDELSSYRPHDPIYPLFSL